MAKRNKRKSEEPRELTRKEHRQRARDRERNRKLYLGAGIALGLALLFVVIGLISEFALRPTRTVASVNGDRIVAREYWQRVFLEQNRMQNQYVQLAQLEQQFGGQGFFASQLNQLQATLSSPFTLGVEVLDRMIREDVVRQAAAERGITVSEEEIDEAIRAEVASRAGAVTVAQATATSDARAAATVTAESWTPTPTATVDVSSTITATATPIPTPVPPSDAPIITDEEYQTGLEEFEQNLQEIAGMSLDKYRGIVEARLLEDKLREVVTEEEVTRTEKQVHARHILLRVTTPTPEPTALPEGAPTLEPTATATPLAEGEPTPIPTPAPRGEDETLALAQEIRQRLLDGEDFATLAEEYSDDPGSAANGGDLGWFGEGAMVAPFEEAAFSLQPGEISEPVQTDFGYHIIEVLEVNEERPKDPNALEQERAQAFQTWIEEQINAADVERPDDLMAMLPRNLEAIVPGAQQPIQSQPVIPDTQSSDATTGGDTAAPADEGTQ